MNTSPCRQCPMRDHDKNNRTCLNCDKRIRFVVGIGRSLGDPRTTSEENYALPYQGRTVRLAV